MAEADSSRNSWSYSAEHRSDSKVYNLHFEKDKGKEKQRSMTVPLSYIQFDVNTLIQHPYNFV